MKGEYRCENTLRSTEQSETWWEARGNDRQECYETGFEKASHFLVSFLQEWLKVRFPKTSLDGFSVR